MNVTIITYKNQDIEILVNENEVQWVMHRGEEKYANSVLLPSSEIHDLVGAIGTIVINAVRTIEELDKMSKIEKPKKVVKKAVKKTKKTK
jgi:hypothetical protein